MELQPYKKSETRFLLLEGVHRNAVEALEKAGYTNIEYISHALDEAALIEKIKGARFVGIRSRTQLTEKVINAADRLTAIGCFCIGTNQVDLEAAKMRGIPVFNAPYSNTRSVAELVIGQLILMLRGIPEKSWHVHNGTWPKTAANAYEARGKTLGIVGYGSIGSQLSVLAEGLGMNVIYYDVVTKLPLGNASQIDSMDELLRTSDVVSLHVPELESTKNMMTKVEFNKMKSGAIFINAARGTCVKIEDLVTALDEKRLSGAAIDVFPSEPKSNEEPLESPLRGYPNVILTPHIGGSTVEAQANIGLEVADKFVQFAQSGTTVSAVNFPQIALTARPNTHRLLHIHHNQPGVLSNVNRLFAEHDINILAQSMTTKDEIGYLLIDVAEFDSTLAYEHLQSVEGTIRLRVLY
ncbi:D-3-phosphoglycerate dehydrogenase [Methylophaga frappieri]|uniref:D-3-phosphoglycerate dehydrogenase n=1 Tax=Methylophaga frappieri (strain ATCC BAA-2434 / DSM 25690 / JAM7) TaxID=754477 RepID=I1YIL0_METFJ|nr:phosphoglycerate dehydrogenase [Methylophaga frappieri]AFJ02753.1 D-3-phosphoglycerate dehydrogenase [Methylophaga frappieri]